ncbi:MAG: hypothetical protein OEY85_02780 [Rhodospirillales bacterium]|nr:hypothetical protein [Rhodospirillales bacterium]
MADIVKISESRISRPGTPASRPVEWPDSFREGRKFEAVADPVRSPAAAAFWSALERLERILASGQALRNDVPRGYYLNILV